MKCKQCGFENRQDARVCAGCGAALSTGAARIKKVTVEEAVQMMEKKAHDNREKKTCSASDTKGAREEDQTPESNDNQGEHRASEMEKKEGIHRFGWIFIGLGIGLALIVLLLLVTMLM